MTHWLPMPTWDNLHPIIIHFPIALLLVAPLFIFLGLVRPAKLWAFSMAALLLMLLGTAGAYIAVETGEATAQLVDQTPRVHAAIEEHQAYAEKTRLIFTVLTALFALLAVAPLAFRKLKPAPILAAQGLFLVVYMASCLVLARTGHLGGRLVHGYGVHVMLGEPLPPPPPEESGDSDAVTPVKTDDKATTK